MRQHTERLLRIPTLTAPRLPVVISVILLLLVTMGWSLASTQTKDVPDAKYTPSKHSGQPPAGEFDAGVKSPPDDPPHRAREMRGKGFYKEIRDPGKLVRGAVETNHVRFIDAVRIGGQSSTPLPVSDADLIVLGTITSARAFVSRDHTYIYSDYTVTVDEVLKPDGNVSPNGTIVMSRPGGSIHFPSGHVTTYMISGQGFLSVGSRYILFVLDSDKAAHDYEIETALQLKDGITLPTDDATGLSGINGLPQDSVLKTLRSLIADERRAN